MDQADDRMVRRALFQRLFAQGRPVLIGDIAAALGREESSILAQIVRLEAQGLAGPAGLELEREERGRLASVLLLRRPA